MFVFLFSAITVGIWVGGGGGGEKFMCRPGVGNKILGGIPGMSQGGC